MFTKSTSSALAGHPRLRKGHPGGFGPNARAHAPARARAHTRMQAGTQAHTHIHTRTCTYAPTRALPCIRTHPPTLTRTRLRSRI